MCCLRSEKIPKLTYKWFVLIFSVLGFLVSTLGLELILNIAVPLLTFIYPTSIVLVLVSFVSIFIKIDFKYAYIIPTISTLIISVMQIVNDFNLVPFIARIYQWLPLADIELAWLIPFIVLFVIGGIIDYFKQPQPQHS